MNHDWGLAARLLQNPGSMILFDRPRPIRFHNFRETAHCVSTLPGEEGSRELVEFGHRIGMRPEWLHHRGVPGREHFDLFDEAIDRARNEGAKEVGRREFVERFIRGTRNPVGSAPEGEPRPAMKAG